MCLHKKKNSVCLINENYLCFFVQLVNFLIRGHIIYHANILQCSALSFALDQARSLGEFLLVSIRILVTCGNPCPMCL